MIPFFDTNLLIPLFEFGNDRLILQTKDSYFQLLKIFNEWCKQFSTLTLPAYEKIAYDLMEKHNNEVNIIPKQNSKGTSKEHETNLQSRKNKSCLGKIEMSPAPSRKSNQQQTLRISNKSIDKRDTPQFNIDENYLPGSSQNSLYDPNTKDGKSIHPVRPSDRTDTNLKGARQQRSSSMRKTLKLNSKHAPAEIEINTSIFPSSTTNANSKDGSLNDLNLDRQLYYSKFSQTPLKVETDIPSCKSRYNKSKREQ